MLMEFSLHTASPSYAITMTSVIALIAPAGSSGDTILLTVVQVLADKCKIFLQSGDSLMCPPQSSLLNTIYTALRNTSHFSWLSTVSILGRFLKYLYRAR